MTTRLLLVMLCGALAACSSFDARWRAATPGASRWEGRWTSEKHAALGGGGPAGGRLRCILTPADAQAQRAEFRANWLVFAGDYSMALKPVPGSRTDFRGTHDLPSIFGGTYRYTAHIRGDDFTARYDSSYDHGIFRLRRVPAAKDSVPGDTRH